MIYSLKLAKNESNFESDFEHPTFQGVTNERALTQGVASLALGYALHWAFSPSILNPKLKSI